MIQFNLLPDVKLEFIKAERLKRLVISISFVASTIAFAALIVLLFSVDFLQHKNLSDLNGDIVVASSRVKNSPDLDKVLTIQSQLSSLTSLHQQKPVASRLFTYLSQVTPSNVTISNVNVDFTQNTATLTGNAPTIDSINTYVDTLKFTTYTSGTSNQGTKAFSSVVLTSFGRSTSGATYNISLNIDKTIFDGSVTSVLTVPNTVTTRSVTNQASTLFKKTDTSK